MLSINHQEVHIATPFVRCFHYLHRPNSSLSSTNELSVFKYTKMHFIVVNQFVIVKRVENIHIPLHCRRSHSLVCESEIRLKSYG